MKKFMIALFMSLMLVRVAWCMEEQQHGLPEHVQKQAQGQEEKIKIATSDGVEVEVPKERAELFGTLKNVMGDLSGKELQNLVIPLPEVNNDQWISISELFGVLAAFEERDRQSELEVLFNAFEVNKLLSIITPLEYLDPVMPGLNSSQQLVELIIKIVFEKIKADPDVAIESLRKGRKGYEVPEKFRSQIVQALLRAKIIGEPYKRFSSEGLGYINSVVWSLDGRLALVGLSDLFIFLNPNERPITMKAKGGSLYSSVEWLPNGNLVIKDQQDVRIMKINKVNDVLDITGYEIIDIRNLGEKVLVACSSGGRLAVVGVKGAIIVEPDMEPDEKGRRFVFSKPLLAIKTVEWSSDGRSLLAFGMDRLILIQLDLGKAQPIRSQLSLHIDSVKLSPDGSRIAVIGDNSVFIVGADAKSIRVKIEDLGYVGSVLWSPDGSRLAVSGYNGTIIVGPDGRSTQDETKGLYPIRSVLWSPDGSRLVGSFVAGRGLNGLIILELNGRSTIVETKGLDEIRSVKWSPDGNLLVVSGPHGVRIVDPDGRLAIVETEGLGEIRLVEWSPDGSRLVVVGSLGVSIVEPNGKSTRVETEGLGEIRLVKWSPDGIHLVVVGINGFIIYSDIPQEYKNLSIPQVFLIIKLAGQVGPRDLDDEENKIYPSLPEAIRKIYPV